MLSAREIVELRRKVPIRIGNVYGSSYWNACMFQDLDHTLIVAHQDSRKWTSYTSTEPIPDLMHPSVLCQGVQVDYDIPPMLCGLCKYRHPNISIDVFIRGVVRRRGFTEEEAQQLVGGGYYVDGEVWE